MMGRQEGLGAAAGQASTMNTTNVTSPYLNFNPAFITPSENQYLYLDPEPGAKHGRGRFELMFNTIGGTTAAGGIFGGVTGAVAGFTDTKNLQGAARRTQMINFVAKRGASWAQMCGIVALMYSGIGTILHKSRGTEDELNTIVAATSAGLLFKSTAGLKGCLKGGLAGFGLSSVYLLYTSSDKLKMMVGR